MNNLQSLLLAELKSILPEIGFCSLNKKNELVLRVYLLVTNMRNLILYSKKMEITEYMKNAEDLIYEQFQDEFFQEKDQLRKQKYSSKRASFSNLNIPTDVSEMTGLLTVLKSQAKFYSDPLSSKKLNLQKLLLMMVVLIIFVKEVYMSSFFK